MKKLIVGLGNPGEKYLWTRHNAGFIVIDKITEILNLKSKEESLGIYYNHENLIFLKPKTFMNESGVCVLYYLKKFNICTENVLIIYDDIYLPLGKFRYRTKGSSGGQNGMKNIIEKLNTNNIQRIKIGIGYNENIKLNEWVLGKLNNNEKKQIENRVEILLKILNNWKKNIDLIREINKMYDKQNI